ncbi:MAG TPA: FHA domain-containing protein [Gemmatimonadaceae bacterium]|nr:FHA domain-containing protein [Gemmatimonadaceae bacterium]
MPYLEFEQEIRPLGPGVLTIGSGTEAQWRVTGHDLAPLHAVLTVDREGHVIVVRGAPAVPVVVNGRDVDGPRTRIAYGDVLQLGSARFTYLQYAKRAVDREAYLHDTRRGRLYKLTDVIEIGRDVKCAVLIQEPDVSRVHAEVLRRANGEYMVKAVGSAYTLLNGVRLPEPTTLKEGDELGIGRTVLRFTFEPPQRAVAAAGRPFAADKRASKMQTTFMGSIDARERVVRDERRRYGLIFVVVAFILGAIFVIVNRT